MTDEANRDAEMTSYEELRGHFLMTLGKLGHGAWSYRSAVEELDALLEAVEKAALERAAKWHDGKCADLREDAKVLPQRDANVMRLEACVHHGSAAAIRALVNGGG